LDALSLMAEKKYPELNDQQAWNRFVNDIVNSGNAPKLRGTAPSANGVFDRVTNINGYTGTHRHRFGADGHGLGIEGRTQATSITGSLSNLVATRGSMGSLNVHSRGSMGSLNTLGSTKNISWSKDSISSKPTTALRLSVDRKKTGSIAKLSSDEIGALKLERNVESRSNSTLMASVGSMGRLPPMTENSKTPLKPVEKPMKKQGPSVFDRLTETSGYTGAHKLRFNGDGTGRGLAGRDSIPLGHNPGTYRGGDVKDLSQILRK